MRPKWGIYRSLNNDQYLRDEEVLFANFSIEELNTLSADEFSVQKDIVMYPNPAKDSLSIAQTHENSYDSLFIVNTLGQVLLKELSNEKSIDISKLNQGTYFVIFKKNNKTVASKKLVVQ